MENNENIINRVASSSLISFDLEDYYHKGERVVYDLKDNLFQGLILKEKDFREFLRNHDWTEYKDKNVAVLCSADAIVPTWAYMLLITYIQPYAHMVICGGLAELEQALFREFLGTVDIEKFRDAKVVVKGCGNLPVPLYAYGEITRLLRPVAASIMYGEPCSTVPLYKKAKEKKQD